MTVSSEAKAFRINSLVVVIAGEEKSWEWVSNALKEHFRVRGRLDIKPFHMIEA